MKQILKILIIISLFISCDKAHHNISTNIIKVRAFNFVDDTNEIFNSQKIRIKGNKTYTYMYEFDKHTDTIKIIDNDFYYNNNLLKIIDKKNVVYEGKIITIYKCYYKDIKQYKFDKYLYLNDKVGLIFLENLFSAEMYEFDMHKYAVIHKNIALKKINFKEGAFELQFAKMNYPDLKN